MTEISKDYVTVCVEEDVVRLDVPVHPFHLVEAFDGDDELCKDVLEVEMIEFGEKVSVYRVE